MACVCVTAAGEAGKAISVPGKWAKQLSSVMCQCDWGGRQSCVMCQSDCMGGRQSCVMCQSDCMGGRQSCVMCQSDWGGRKAVACVCQGGRQSNPRCVRIFVSVGNADHISRSVVCETARV